MLSKLEFDAQNEYNAAFQSNNFSHLIELAKTYHHAGNIDLNPLQIADLNDPDDFEMTLAAELLARRTPETTDLVLQLVTLSGFDTNKELLTDHHTFPVDALHMACWYGDKEILRVCLASLKAKGVKRAEAYLNRPIKMTKSLYATPLAMAFINKTNNTKDISGMLYQAGGDPYVFFTNLDGNKKSLLNQLDPEHPSFNDYIEMLRRNPKKLTAFLNKTMSYIHQGTEFQLNIMEECLLTVKHELEKLSAIGTISLTTEESPDFKISMIVEKSPDIKISMTVYPLPNVPNIQDIQTNTNNPMTELLKALTRVNLVKQLYQEFCFELEGNPEGNIRKNWRNAFFQAQKNNRSEEENFIRIISGSADQITFPLRSLQHPPYLPCRDRVRNFRFIDYIADVSVPHEIAYKGIRTDLNDPITPLLYDESMRRKNQPYIGHYKGHTPLSLAVLTNYSEFILRAIRANHPELNSPIVFGQFRGYTPLILSIFMKSKEITLALLHYFFITQKLNLEEFSNEPLRGEIAGLTLKTAIIHADAESRAFYNQLMQPQKSKSKLQPAPCSEKAGSLKQPPAHSKKAKAEPLVSAQVAYIFPHGNNTAHGNTVKEASHAVRVYNSELQQIKSDAQRKLEQLNTLSEHDRSELEALFVALNRMASIAPLIDDEDGVAKKEECVKATHSLKDFFRRFNALHKECMRRQRQHEATSSTSKSVSSITTTEDDNDDNDDNSHHDENAEQLIVETTVKPKLMYDPSSTPLKVLHPSKPAQDLSKTTGRKNPKPPKNHNKMSFEQLGELFNQPTATASTSAWQTNLPAHRLVVLCQDKIDALKKLFHAYQRHCLEKQRRGIFDVDSAIVVSAMSADTLAIYETLLTLQRDYPAFGIFKNQGAATAWRDMSKYAYVYIFSHEACYFETLISKTLELIPHALANCSQDKGESWVDANQRPPTLVQAVQSGSLPCPPNHLMARYINLLTLIEDLNTRGQKVGDLSNRDHELARAKLFCLALLGLVIKENGTPVETMLKKTYSNRLLAAISRHPSGIHFDSDLQTEKTSALLNFFSLATKKNDKEYVFNLIHSLSISDMSLLLREILNVTSHQVESEWVTLLNRHIREVADCIAKQCQKVFSNSPASFAAPAIMTYADRAEGLLYSLNQCRAVNYITQQAAGHIFFKNVIETLQHIEKNNSLASSHVVNSLLESLGALNRFDTFAKNFLITGAAKETLDNARRLINEALNQPVQEIAYTCNS